MVWQGDTGFFVVSDPEIVETLLDTLTRMAKRQIVGSAALRTTLSLTTLSLSVRAGLVHTITCNCCADDVIR